MYIYMYIICTCTFMLCEYSVHVPKNTQITHMQNQKTYIIHVYLLILHVGNLGIFIVAVYFKSILSLHS